MQEQFNLMPNNKCLIENGIKLAKMLKSHKFTKGNVGVRLFKAKYVENSTLKNSIR